MRSMLLLFLFAPTALAETPEVEALDVHGRMATHMELTERARAALIAGDLDGVKAAAVALQELPTEGYPVAWQPTAEEITAWSRLIADADSLPSAAWGLSAVGQTCAGCHTAVSGGPDLDGTKVPPQEWGDASHMQQHDWAATWMWIGVIKPDAEAYERGARMLAEQPFYAEAAMNRNPAMSQGFELQVHDLAEAALATQDPGERADRYAELLGTCGKCHVAMGSQAPPVEVVPAVEPKPAVEPEPVGKGKKKGKKNK